MTDLKLPQSEAEFMQLMSTKNSKERQRVAAGLAHAHRDDPQLTSLLRELLHTEVCCEKIPIKNPGSTQSPDNQSQDSDWAVVADSEMVPLVFPQSNASVKFMQRELAISMALVAGTQIALMLEAAQHPSMAGKAAVLGYLAKAATDDDLVALYAKCVPGVQESLWENLKDSNRKAACKMIRPSSGGTPGAAFTLEDFAAMLEACAVRERGAKWDKLPETVEYQQLRKLSWKEVAQAESPMQPVVKRLFELAEKYSPLRNTAPMLHPRICDVLHYLLRSDCERTVKLVQATSFDMMTGPNPKPTFDPPPLFLTRGGKRKKCGQYWRRETQQQELLPFFDQILSFDNRRLVFEGCMNGKWTGLLFWVHQPILELLAQRGLALMEEAWAMAKGRVPDDTHEFRNCVSFVIDIMTTLGGRLCSIASKPAKEDAQPDFEVLLGKILDTLMGSLGAKSLDAYSMVLSPCRNLFQSFPPLAERFFNLCLSQKFLERDGQIIPFASQLYIAVLTYLAPPTYATNIFEFPNDGLEPKFWRVPAWSNEAAFEFLCRDFSVSRDSLYYSLKLTPQQRAKLFSMFPMATLMQDFKKNWPQIDGLLQNLAPSAQAKHEVAWAARDMEDVQGLRRMQQYWDISIPAVRELFQSNLSKRTYEERHIEMQLMLTATKNSDSVAELIATLAFLFPRVKNEIMPNQNSFGGLLHILTPADCASARATREQAQQLAKLFLAFDADLLAGVSVAWNPLTFIKSVAVEAISRFAGQPDHPFFQFGCEILWRRTVHSNGTVPAARAWSVSLSDWTGPVAGDAEQERERRVAIAGERKSTEEQGIGIGNKRIPQGAEAKFVTEVLRQYAQRWEQAGVAADALVDLSRVQALILLLGGRWESCPQLVAAVEQQLQVLANAPRSEKHKEGEEKVPLCWCQDPAVNAAKGFIIAISGRYSAKHLRGHSWWQKFCDLRLQSCDATTEARYRYQQCNDATGKLEEAKAEAVVRSLLQISLSALHLDFVAKFLMTYRQDWVTAEMLTATKYRGLFHASDNELVLDTDTPSDLFPWQCALLAKKYLACAHSAQVRLDDRVRAVEKYTRLPTTTVEELSAFLVSPSLPQRLEEAVLMFLPKLNEPATGIQLLLAPVYLGSDVARTAIHAAKGSLAYIPQNMLGKLLESLFPPEESKGLKVTVFKELVRLTAEHIAIPACQQLLMRLWRRTKLHVDVRVVFVQMAINLVGNHDENIRELGWTIIQDATAADFRGTAVALVLLRVRAERAPYRGDCNGIMPPFQITEYEDLAWQILRPIHCQRFLDTALLPLCEPPAGVEPTSKVFARVNEQVPWFAYRQLGDFITADNAEATVQRLSRVAIAASTVPTLAIFKIVMYQLNACVALDPQAGPEKPWGQFQQVLSHLARVLGDSTQPPATRQQAKNAIQELGLQARYIFPKLEAAALDRMLVETTLRSQGVSNWYWKELFQRKLAVAALGWTFIPPEHEAVGAAQTEHNMRVARAAMQLIQELADKCARWKLKDTFLTQQTAAIFSLVNSAARDLQVVLLENLSSIAPSVRTSLHLQLLRLPSTTPTDRLSIMPLLQSEMEQASLQLAVSQRDDPINDFSSWRTLQPTFAREIAEIVRNKNVLDLISTRMQEPDVITPIGQQAQAESWRGPASQLLWILLLSSPVVVFARLPSTICQFIATAVEIGRHEYMVVLISLINFVERATVESCQQEALSDPLVLGPYTASLIEMISKGYLHCLDLSLFLRPNDLKAATVKGADVFPYSALAEEKAPVTDLRPACLKDLPAPRAVPYNSEGFVPRLGDVWCRAGTKLLDAFPRAAVAHPSLYCSLIVQSMERGLMAEGTLVELASRVMRGGLQRNGSSTRTAEGVLWRWPWAPSRLLALEITRMFLPKYCQVATCNSLVPCAAHADDRHYFLRCAAAVSMLKGIANLAQACNVNDDKAVVVPNDNKEAMGKLWGDFVEYFDAQQCPRFKREALKLASLRRTFE